MIPLEYMPPLMFGGLVIFMLVGFPVAFSLMALVFFKGYGKLKATQAPKA